MRALLLCSLLAATAAAADPAALMTDLAIEVTPDHPREFIFTDKGAAHLSGEAVGAPTRSYHGFFIAMHELLDGWRLTLADGTELRPEQAVRAVVRPDRLERAYRLADGGEVREIVTLLDRADGFHVRYEGLPGGTAVFTPRVDMRFLWKVERPRYDVRWEDGALAVAREDRRTRPAGERHPPWLAVLAAGAAEFTPTGTYLPARYPKGEARVAMEQATPYEPGGLAVPIPPRAADASLDVVVCAADTPQDARARARALLADAATLADARRARLAAVVEAGFTATGRRDHTKALAWARVSLDNLVMEQRGLGIYAGFYWFTTYWGRDAFIVLPGALAAGMEFGTARDILESFAAYQERNPHSPRFGRVPNFVTVEQVQYASIDGTWWWVRALDEYWRRSGDETFIRAMMPVVFRACEGALAHAVDDHGYLTHGDGETWMDGGGEANPYSPRGDRAVEIQALFHRGLRTAARLAARFDGEALGLRGDELARRYDLAARRLWNSFQRDFVMLDRIADHLDRDGAPDLQHRPNGLLALLVSPELFNEDQRRLIVRENMEHTVKPWGVRSLDAADPAYHPRHLWLDRYYYDEAYHNGDIWLWLSGPWVSALPDPRGGFGQTEMLLDEVLHVGAVGTIQEIRDGDRAASNDEFGGATSQAWSLSELLRTVAEDYAGITADLTGETPRIVLAPAVPEAWPELTVRQRVGDRLLTVRAAGERVLEWSLEPPAPDWSVEVR
ncbi:MAG TPA: amylo-alpha-1,6-glucosidase [Candidatus Krumholzibacteria bacterium]|nr:amylo-alpha-1,6-glucosidase [Candidatus Krumholzibacteria bacterium]